MSAAQPLCPRKCLTFAFPGTEPFLVPVKELATRCRVCRIVLTHNFGGKCNHCLRENAVQLEEDVEAVPCECGHPHDGAGICAVAGCLCGRYCRR